MPLCERDGFDIEASAPEGCYIADPSDIHALFGLHELLNTPLVGDTGGADMVLRVWERENDTKLTMENVSDMALLHSELTRQRGPQRVINAIMCDRKTPEEPTLPGAEEDPSLRMYDEEELE